MLTFYHFFCRFKQKQVGTRLLGFAHAFVRVETTRVVAQSEQVWLSATKVGQAKLHLAKIDGGENHISVTPIQKRQEGSLKMELISPINQRPYFLATVILAFTLGLASLPY